MKKIAILLCAAALAMISGYAQVSLGSVTQDGMIFTAQADGTANVKAASTALTGSVTIPESVEIDGKSYTVTAIADGGFKNCQTLLSVELPSTLVTIGNSAFYDCGIADIILPEGLETIGAGAFASHHGVGLTRIIIPATVKSIGEQAFYNQQLTYVDIEGDESSPQLTIGAKAFSGTRRLIETIRVARPTPPVLGEDIFTLKEVKEPIYLYGAAATKLDEYKAATGWNALNLVVETVSGIITVDAGTPADMQEYSGDGAAIYLRGAEIYSLDGVRQTADSLRPGIYIVRTVSGTAKIAFR